MKGFLFVLIIVWLSEGHAMRCNNDLVLEGDYIIQVAQKCGRPDSYTHLGGIQSDLEVMTYKQEGGMTETLVFRMGQLESIEHNRMP